MHAVEDSRAACPTCRASIGVPFAQRTIEVTRVCAGCNRTWRVTATPVVRLDVGVVTRVSFVPEPEA